VNRARCRVRTVLPTLALGLLSVACGIEGESRNDWPDGTLVIARREAVSQLAKQIQALPESKLARMAEMIGARLPDCSWVETRIPDGGTLLDSSIDCSPSDDALRELDRERGESDAVFAFPEQNGTRVVGTLDLTDDGDVDVRLRVPENAFTDARTLLKPGSAEPGPNLLSHVDELVHARLRPQGGLDIASLVPEQSQGDRMFRLKSEIFAGAVLDGTWEMAIYLPEPAAPMPRAALALGFSIRTPAVNAMERFISDLQESWPVRRVPLSLAAGEGACLPGLNLLPDLAPCYVATQSALVVGWNVASIERALEKGDAARIAPHSASGLHVDLARFPEADARFAESAMPGEEAAEMGRLPWKRISANGVPETEGVDVRIRFDGGDGA